MVLNFDRRLRKKERRLNREENWRMKNETASLWERNQIRGESLIGGAPLWPRRQEPNFSL